MAKRSKSTGVVDGFTTLKAAQRAKNVEPDDPSKTSATTPSGANASGAGRRSTSEDGTRINHTAMPTKHELMCYECEYEFYVTGVTTQTFCPKCRTELIMRDQVIEGEWSEDLKTAGKIHITPSGVIKSGTIMATDIVLEGSVEGGHLEAYRRLEIGEGAKFKAGLVQSKDLTVLAGGNVTFRKSMTYRDVEVSGRLKGNLHASGLLTIRSGGLVDGKVSAEHLIVEEGGGLKADLKIKPLPPESSEKPEDPLKKTA